jgi:hypothetical protein
MGDVFVGAGNGFVFEYDPNGNLVQKMRSSHTTSETTGMAFDSAGNLYSTNFGANAIAKFSNTGVLMGDFGSGFNSDPESLVFDMSGNLYVGQADGTHDILKFAPGGGAPIQTFVPFATDRGTDWIDLAADQHTVYWAGEGPNVRKADLTGAPGNGSVFSNKGSRQFALRLLPVGNSFGGFMLVADTSNVLMLDASGNIMKTYTGFAGASELFALNLDPDGKTFWTGDIGGSTQVFHVDIATGTIIKSWAASKDGATEVAGLSVFGEITQGGPPPGVPEPLTVPTMGAGLAVLAWLWRRRLSNNRLF